MPAFNKMVEGQKISFDKKIENGAIVALKEIPVKTHIYNIESKPGDGGVFIKSAGSSAIVNKVIGGHIFVLMPSKKEKSFTRIVGRQLVLLQGQGDWTSRF